MSEPQRPKRRAQREKRSASDASLLSVRHPATAGLVSGLVLLVVGVPISLAIGLAPNASEPDAVIRFVLGYLALIVLASVLIGLLVRRVQRRDRPSSNAGWLMTMVRAFGTIVLVSALVVLDLALVMPPSIRGLAPVAVRPQPTISAVSQTPAPTTAPTSSPTPSDSPSPSPSASASASPSPQPTGSPVPSPSTATTAANGTVLYQADWSKDAGGWIGPAEWKNVPGLLVSDGSNNGGDTVVAPFQPPTRDYAIEATIRAINPGGCYFGVVGRSTSEGHYTVGYNGGRASIGSTHSYVIAGTGFDPGKAAHVYRAEFRGNRITLIIDGNAVTQTTDNDFLAPGQVGLASASCQIEVSTYRVLALS